nr:hypothetical protein [Marseillevirus cajuinensis]
MATRRFQRPKIASPLEEEDYKKIESKAEELIQRIEEKLPVFYPLTTTRNFEGVFVGTTHFNLFFIDKEGVYTLGDFREKERVSEDQLVEAVSDSVSKSAEIQPYITNKSLAELNTNFEKLFLFLKESVELVPGSERVQEVQKRFEANK